MEEKDLIIAELRAENQMLRQMVSSLEKKVEMLMAKVAQLEAKLAKNSSNSSKPPSSDGPNSKPAPKSLRQTNKASGGQVGHKGNTLMHEKTPDEIKVIAVCRCKDCNADLTQARVRRYEKRQVFDVQIKRHVTEYQGEVKHCLCGCKNRATFPTGVEAYAQFGPTLKAVACHLSDQFIPKDRLSNAIQELFGIEVSDTSIFKWEEGLAENLKDLHEAIHFQLLMQPVKHCDETGIYVNGKNAWLHVLCNKSLTQYTVDAKRKNIPFAGLGTHIHDHFKTYFKKSDPRVLHALCNAHHLRELNCIIELHKENWAWKMRRLLKFAIRLTDPLPEVVDRISTLYDRIVASGLKFHESLSPLPSTRRKRRRTGHNLLLRFLSYKDAALRFLTQPGVPFTNNQAERDIRMMKIKNKVSGGFRTYPGAHCFAIIRSAISTAAKNGITAIALLREAIQRPIQSFEDLLALS